MKIEDKVKEIVETSSMLSIREKSDIICLIECYKNIDNLSKLCIEKIAIAVENLKELQGYDIEAYLLDNEDSAYEDYTEEYKEHLNNIIDNLKKGLLI